MLLTKKEQQHIMAKSNKTPIHEILGLTKRNYEMRVMQLMLKWSECHCNGSTKIQQLLLVNPLINKWFLLEYTKLLKEFKNRLKPYLNNEKVSNIDKQKLWLGTVDEICEIHPRALIKQEIKCK